jgi:hypothetical protein
MSTSEKVIHSCRSMTDQSIYKLYLPLNRLEYLSQLKVTV